MDTDVRTLSNLIIGEIFNALGFKKFGIAFRSFNWIFRKPADRLAGLCLEADHIIAAEGISKSAGWLLPNWCKPVISRGTESIPRSGPLIVLSNHAGTYDSFVITSEVGRDDIKIITSDVPFLKNFPEASKHTIFLSDNIRDRTISARVGIRHLREGGSLLLYGTGLIDPDPAVYNGSEAWIEKWLPSIDLFLRIVPETSVVFSIVSGVVSERWAHHPITWLKKVDWQKRRLAEFGQVIQQLYFPGTLFLNPRISFSNPNHREQLLKESVDGRVISAAINQGKALLNDHLVWIRSLP
jgi:hypothetical protein